MATVTPAGAGPYGGRDAHAGRWLRDFWAFVAAALIGLLLAISPQWHALELRVYDGLVVRTAPGQVSLPITIVAIDEESMAQLGRQWPWPRSVHARLLERLREAGVVVAVFDVVFAEPSSDPAEDRALARAIADFGPVVLAAHREYRETERTRQWIRVDPLATLTDAGASAGLATIRSDPDGVQRAIPLSRDALWREVLRRFDQRHPGVVSRSDAGASERIRYLGGAGTFPRVSYYRLLDPDRHLSASWKEALRDNIVLVGRTLHTTTELNSVEPDMLLTPFFSTTGALMPGVEVHANIVANMIAGETLVEAPRGWALALVVAAAALAALAMRRWHPARAGGAAVLLIAGIALLDWALFRHFRTWLPAGAAVAAVAAGYVGQGVSAFLRERARRLELRRLFSLYVAPAVVDRIVHDPDALRLGGERRLLTVLFTDLEGFTAISESLAPEAVVELLNRHLTDMTAIVLRHGGTVDKFIGDAVMAFWGAPFPDPEQSRHALEAAVEMQAAMARMRDEVRAAGGPELRMRIGVHCAECIVGNLGGSGRFAYTAVGDGVNLAARLESANNVYGTAILASETVARAVEGGRLPMRAVDTVRVRGRQQPVSLFTPCDDPVLIERTAEALDAWRRGEREVALVRWERIAADHPGDGVARVFVARLRSRSSSDWPQPWDGVTTLDSK